MRLPAIRLRSMRMSPAIVFGLIGMLTGVSSLFLSWQTREEESAIVLNAYPTASSVDLTHAGFGLRVELVNQSLRPIVIRSASLWDAGEMISDGVGYLDDVSLLDASNVDPGALTRRRRDFPITLAARQGRTVAILMDVWTPVVTASSPTGEVNARTRLNRFLTRVASLSQSADDVSLLDASNVDPSALTRRRRDFPITLAARQGRTVALLMDVWTPVVTAPSPTGEVNARTRLNRFLTRVASLSQSAADDAIQLRLDSLPGGSRTFTVRSVAESSLYPEAIKSAGAIEKQASFQSWVVVPRVRKRTLLDGMLLRRTFAGTGEVDIVHLDLWKEGSLEHRRISRPVVGQQSTLFPLTRLAPGRYTGTFELDGHVVAYRSFALPWKDSCSGAARAALSGSGAATPRWCENR